MLMTKHDKEFEIVEYEEGFGEYSINEKLFEELKGQPIEEQIEYFDVEEETVIEKYSYGRSNGSSVSDKKMKPWECSDVKGVVVKNGIIIGLWVRSWNSSKQPLFINKTVQTYTACDDDGPGSTSREDYVTLFAISKE